MINAKIVVVGTVAHPQRGSESKQDEERIRRDGNGREAGEGAEPTKSTETKKNSSERREEEVNRNERTATPTGAQKRRRVRKK